MPLESKKPSLQENDPLPRKTSPLAGLLSLFVPGFGQIYQGRIGKGVLFFVCIYLMFFYGFALGKGKNVYLAETSHLSNPWSLPDFPADLYNRPQYVAQFCTGVVAWPALWQYRNYDEDDPKATVFGTFQRAQSEEELNDLQRNSDKSWDLGWVMTVIAGALNVLVVYDAASGPAFTRAPSSDKVDKDKDYTDEKDN